MIARATIRRWAMPPDSAATGSLPRSESRNCPSRRSASDRAVFAAIPKKRPWKYRFSHTESDRSSVLVCGTTPMTCFAAVGCATTSMPPTNARPLVGITRVVSMPAVVVFPAPFGPSSPKISPWWTSRSSSSTAFNPPGYTLVSCSVRITTSSATDIDHHLPLLLALGALVEKRLDARQRAREDFDVALGEDAPQLVVELVHDLVELGEARESLVGDDHAHDAPVGGIGPALDETFVGELVEVADECGRFDAHVLRELALAGTLGVRRFLQQHPVPEAGAVLAEPAVELVVHRPVGQEEQPPDGRFHSALMISTLIIRSAISRRPRAVRDPHRAPSPHAPAPRGAGRSTRPRGRPRGGRTRRARGCGSGRRRRRPACRAPGAREAAGGSSPGRSGW